MSLPKTAPERCPIRQDLLQSLVAAMDKVLDLGALEIAAVTNGEPGPEVERIGDELAQAMNTKAAILRAYNSHLSSHRCA